MPRNYADTSSVAKAILSVMSVKPRIESQTELARLVVAELRKDDPAARVSTSRIRKIAVSTGIVKLEIEYRESDRKDLPDLCPVCGSGMSPIINNTLDGARTEIKRNCTVCPYTVGKNILIPGKYAFIRSASTVTDGEIRLRKLRKAASMLRGAEKLIDEALEGTNFPQRGEYAKAMIEEILHSKEMTGSLPNLELDIRQENHSDPLWTQSFSTPKYPTRKIFD